MRRVYCLNIQYLCDRQTPEGSVGPPRLIGPTEYLSSGDPNGPGKIKMMAKRRLGKSATRLAGCIPVHSTCTSIGKGARKEVEMHYGKSDVVYFELDSQDVIS